MLANCISHRVALDGTVIFLAETFLRPLLPCWNQVPSYSRMAYIVY